MSWLRHKNGLLIRVSFYADRFGGPGHLDVALTISESKIDKQRPGDWEAVNEIHNLIPSGFQIDPLMKKDLNDDETEKLRRVLVSEAIPFLEKLENPMHAAAIVRTGNWPVRNRFMERIAMLVVESSTNEDTIS